MDSRAESPTPAHVDAPTSTPSSRALLNAIRRGTMDVAQTLFDLGARISSTQIFHLARACEETLIHSILALGPQPHLCVEAFRGACSAGHVRLIQYLIDQGVNAEVGLSLAYENYRENVVEMLVSHGAHDWSVALIGAVHGNHTKLVDTLLTKGADPSFGLSAAAGCGNVDMARRMIALGARNVDQALSDACGSNRAEVVDVLIHHGAALCTFCGWKRADGKHNGSL